MAKDFLNGRIQVGDTIQTFWHEELKNSTKVIKTKTKQVVTEDKSEFYYSKDLLLRVGGDYTTRGDKFHYRNVLVKKTEL